MGVFDKLKELTQEGIDEIKRMPITRKEKELDRKKHQKEELLAEKEEIKKRLIEIDDDVEIVESYIRVLKDELKKMKK